MIRQTHIVSFTCDCCGRGEDRVHYLGVNDSPPLEATRLPDGWSDSEGDVRCEQCAVEIISTDYEAGEILFSLQAKSQDSFEELLRFYFRCGPFDSEQDFWDSYR